MTSSLKYDTLSDTLIEKINQDRLSYKINPYACTNDNVLRRVISRDTPNLWRPAFVRDVEKIMHLPYYNRYADKTQVFSFYHNDDITRRALHVQLVSRIARNIGSVLQLNLDLIEAIALGHDIGHTPFGHAGERYLSNLLYNNTGRYFNHNVHSVRVLDNIFARNLSLQTLDGILCHNGEFEQQEYRPNELTSFEQFDECVERCYALGDSAIEHLVPSTLEGCVVRICDMIAYIGKDRQDAIKARIIDSTDGFSKNAIGSENAEIINNLTIAIISNSYNKDYIALGDAAYSSLKQAKQENYSKIYRNDAINQEYDSIIKPMFNELYNRLLNDIRNNNTSSPIFKHHISFIDDNRKFYNKNSYSDEEPNQIVVDYIASMTDDYFIALHKLLFPNTKYHIEYKSYFDDIKNTLR